jgi:hypothetical protein
MIPDNLEKTLRPPRDFARCGWPLRGSWVGEIGTPASDGGGLGAKADHPPLAPTP